MMSIYRWRVLGAAGKMSTFAHFATDALHVGQEPERWTSWAVVPPISLSTTFKQSAPGVHKGYDYARSGNPTRECLEQCLAPLEGAKYCSVFSSGLATTAATFALLRSGDSILCGDDVYGGTNRYLKRVAINNGITSKMVPMTDLSNFRSHFTETTKLVWLETPSNPLLKVIDIEELVKAVRSINPKILIVVDNTFMSPYFQRPLTMGVDLVMHSITKYINGHSDVIMGCVMTNNKTLAEHFSFQQMAVGAVPSPMDCFLVNRGVKTLHIRMKAHMENAMAVAKYLETEPRVEKVLYPELPSHPQHLIHKKQSKGMSGMISFYMKGDLDNAKTFLSQLKIFCLAESLGGFESLAEHPALMTHASVPLNEREILGIGDNLIRLSVGLEDPEDLIDDIKSALDAAFKNKAEC